MAFSSGAEIDVAGGIKPKFLGPNWSPNIGYVQYFYAPEEVSPTYGEVYAKTDYKFGQDDKFTLRGMIFFAPDFSQTGKTATFIAGGGKVAFWKNFAAYAGVGYQFFEDPHAFEDLAWTAGLSYYWKSLTFDVRYWDTNLKPDECVVRSGFSDGCDARVVGTISLGSYVVQVDEPRPLLSQARLLAWKEDGCGRRAIWFNFGAPCRHDNGQPSKWEKPRHHGVHCDRGRQHGGLWLLPFPGGRRTLRQSRNPRLDRHGSRRSLPRSHIRKARKVSPCNRRALRLYTHGLRRLRGLPDRVGLLDLDMGVTARDCDRVCWCRHGRISWPAQSHYGGGTHARRHLGGSASSTCAASSLPALSPRLRLTQS